MKSIFIKLLNLPSTLCIKFYPRINRMILKAHDAILGKNVQIPGKVSWSIWGGAKY